MLKKYTKTHTQCVHMSKINTSTVIANRISRMFCLACVCVCVCVGSSLLLINFAPCAYKQWIGSYGLFSLTLFDVGH